MNPTALSCLLLLAASSLPSCYQTRIVIVDPHFGFERSHDGRTVAVQGRRARYRWVEDGEPGPDTGALVFHLGDCSTGHVKRLGFTLSFLTSNRSDRSWRIERGMFALENKTDPLRGAASPVHLWSVDPANRSGKDEVMIAVPAGTSAVLDVPIQVVCPAELTEADALRTRFYLSITSPDGKAFLRRQIDIGRWSQIQQGLRAVGAFTVALMIIAAI